MVHTHLTIPYLGPQQLLSMRNRIKILTTIWRGMVYAYFRKLRLIEATYHKNCIQVIQTLYYTCSKKD